MTSNTRILGYEDSASSPRAGDRALAVVSPDDEFLHPLKPDADWRLTETQYFGFNIPAAAINAEIYVWLHPALGTASGGLWIWQGNKLSYIAANYHDYRLFLPMPKRIDDYSLESGLRIQVLEPLKSFLVTFDDSARDTHLRVRLTAIHRRGGGRSNGGHLTQALRTEGQLVLRGVKYAQIDGFSTRIARGVSPDLRRRIMFRRGVGRRVSLTRVFAFHVTAFDTAQYHPDWARYYSELYKGSNLLWGYVWRDGRLRALRSALQHVETEDDGISPRRIVIELIDTEGRKHVIRGNECSALPLDGVA